MATGKVGSGAEASLEIVTFNWLKPFAVSVAITTSTPALGFRIFRPNPAAVPSRPRMKVFLRNLLLLAAVLAVATVALGRWLRPAPFPEPPVAGARLAGEADFRATVARVDAEFAAEWRRLGLAHTGRADELTLLRRLSLALTGTVPSVEEILAAEARPAGDRLQWWLSHLLADARSSDYLAERFARVVAGVEDGPFIVYRRHRLASWLREQIRANRSYDALVKDLLTATGIWTSQPAVNFVTATVDQNNDDEGPDEVKLAARVSRAFLGVRFDCVQCHHDKFGDRWKQNDFHQLAAFFAGTGMSLTGVRDEPAKAYEFRYLGRTEAETVPPKVPFHAELLPAEGPPRERLAAWVTHPDNRPFARTLVNRAWALLFNRPLVKPIDSLPLDGPFPPGLEALTDDLIAHGFDLQRLLRLIAATRVFQLDSRGEPASPPRPGAESAWAAFPLTRLRPEQVAGSILQASNLRTIDADSHVVARLIRFFQQKDFVARYGDLGRDEVDEFSGTIPQRLVLMNGQLVHERTKEDLVFNAATRIGVVTKDHRKAVETAYLATLSRRPGPEELRHFTERLQSGGGKRAERMEDLYWTLLNSTEFSWNH